MAKAYLAVIVVIVLVSDGNMVWPKNLTTESVVRLLLMPFKYLLMLQLWVECAVLAQCVSFPAGILRVLFE